MGAGQRVTQEVFGGRSWHEEPSLIRPMMEAFWWLRQAHESSLLLDLAGRLHRSGRLPLSPEQARRRRELEQALQPARGGAIAAIAAFERQRLGSEVRAFLTGLRGQRSEQQPAPPPAASRSKPRARRRLTVVGS